MTTTVSPKIVDSINAAAILLEDHRRLKSLFREFESADEDVKSSIAMRAIEELELHDTLEETLFYPALRKVADPDDVIKARAAHHGVRVMIKELKLMPSGRRFNAQFKILIENVLSHMKEEETVLIPAAESSLDMTEMGRDMAALKYSELAGETIARSGFGVGALIAGIAAAAAAWFFFSPRD